MMFYKYDLHRMSCKIKEFSNYSKMLPEYNEVSPYLKDDPK